MKNRFATRSLVFALAGVIAVSAAQADPFISINGRLTVSEGGTANASGLLEILKGQPSGRFQASFSRGILASIKLTRVKMVQIPTATAFFEGDGTAVIQRFGISIPVRGSFFGYADDLAGTNPPQPDQLFMMFTTYDGQILVRHGQVVSGDILVNM